MIVERGNALRSTKADISAFKQSNLLKFDCFLHHCNGRCQIYFENLLPNRRFGVEIAILLLFQRSTTIITALFVFALLKNSLILRSKSLSRTLFFERRSVKFAVRLLPYKNKRKKGGKKRREKPQCVQLSLP